MSCCRDTWGGSNTAHCAGCCRTFTGPTAFDRHQRLVDGRVECRAPHTVGLVESSRRTAGGKPIWGAPRFDPTLRSAWWAGKDSAA